MSLSIFSESILPGRLYPGSHHVPPTFKGVALSDAQVFFVQEPPRGWIIPKSAILSRGHLLLTSLGSYGFENVLSQSWLSLAALVYMYYWSERSAEELNLVNRCLAFSYAPLQFSNITQVQFPDDLIGWIEASYYSAIARSGNMPEGLQVIEAEALTTEPGTLSIEARSDTNELTDYVNSLRQAAAALPSTPELDLQLRLGSTATHDSEIKARTKTTEAKRSMAQLHESNILAQRPIAPKPNLGSNLPPS